VDWDKLRIFHAVAQAGSFTHAGEELKLSQSAVSRQVSALEEDLGVPLFHRHARGLILTEQGELLYRAAHDVSSRLSIAQSILADSKERPSGELRVTTTVGFGSTWLTPRIKEFLELYPEMAITLICDDRELNLSMREADVGLRLNEPHQPDLVKRKLVTFHTHIFASPDYIKRRGAPTTLDDLEEHDLIVYGHEAPTSLRTVNWLLTVGKADGQPRRARLQVNNIYALLLAVESGLGLASLPDYMVHGNNRIVQVLHKVAGPSSDAYFVYPEELRNTKRIMVFRDFLLRKVQQWSF
jgi:DNA-binding transcriptional LysR family regulator